MSKNGILVCAPRSKRKNIGDYIQSVAQEQFWDKTDCYVEREELDSFESDKPTNVIMNGWFMIKPQNYPPQPCINPLYISFHIDSRVAKRMLTPAAIEHLKKYEPIGTRDTDTKQLLEKYGIKAYFSGCLTTTLCLKYGNTTKDQPPVFVDPYYEVAGTKKNLYKWGMYARNIYYLFKNWRKVNKFIDRFDNEFWTWYGKLSRKFEKRVCASVFYETYKTICTDELIFNAEYVTHNVETTRFSTNDDWMEYARGLIRRYAKAKFVVTSRIHCALPCLGVETPVIFVQAGSLYDGTLRDDSRFGGLIEMFNVVSYEQGTIIPTTLAMKNLLEKVKLNMSSAFINPELYKKYRDDMIIRTNNFVESVK